MTEHEGREGYVAELVPVALFTENLSFEEEVQLQTLIEAMNRGQMLSERVANGDEAVKALDEPLSRIVNGVSIGSILPILDAIQNGASPDVALRGIIGGVARMFFLGGVEWARMNPDDATPFDVDRHREMLEKIVAEKGADSIVSRHYQATQERKQEEQGVNEDTGRPVLKFGDPGSIVVTGIIGGDGKVHIEKVQEFPVADSDSAIDVPSKEDDE